MKKKLFAMCCLLTAGMLSAAPAKIISRAVAQKAALEKIPDGKIISAEREKEKGKLIWSFDIKTKSGLKEVWVDAHSGEVINIETETPAHEKQERAEDAAKKK